MELSVSVQSSGGIVLTWPASEHAFFLEQSASIPGPWNLSQRPIVEMGGQNHITQAVNVGPKGFFRLREGYGEAARLDSLLLDPFGYDRGPSLSRDGLSLYYLADVGGSIALWFTTRPSVTSAWEPPLPLDAINTPYFETFPALSPNGLALFFSEWHPGDPRTDPRPEGLGGGDLWVSTRPNLRGAWGPPTNLGRVVNTEWLKATPSFSSDGLTLIFTSDRPRGVFGSGRDGNNDLWQLRVLRPPPLSISLTTPSQP